MIGAPSQLELFDYKPDLKRLDGQPCPQSFLEGKNFAFIQGTPNMLGPQFPFKQHGASGAWVSDRLPHFSKVVDDVSFIKTLQTDQFNHGPAQLMVHSGQPRIGYPSIGSWATWGMGTENADLPGFVVLLSGGRIPRVGKALWGSGFLPSVYQGVQCRSHGDPVLNVSNPKGMTRDLRRQALDTIRYLNQQTHDEFGDPETLTRIAQYEMAFRMQMAVPDAMDIEKEPDNVHELYGTEPGKESFANNCLLARRLVEPECLRTAVRLGLGLTWSSKFRGVKRWLPRQVPRGRQAYGRSDHGSQTKRPPRGHPSHLERRIRPNPMRENRGGTNERKYVGRDHNPGAFTAWIAGGGIKPGISYGETDEVYYSPAIYPVPQRIFTLPCSISWDSITKS